MIHQIRRCGILLHPTSLPSAMGIGSFGDEAYAFIDLLERTHITLWQMLPLGPTGYGDSPYAARSTFAGNELLIDLKSLSCEGFLTLDDVLKVPAFSTKRIDYGVIRSFKEPLLDKAARTFLQKADEKQKTQYQDFCRRNSWWLDDYALYVSLCRAYGDSRWNSRWPKALRMRQPEALASAKAEHHNEIEHTNVLQFFFYEQYLALKKYANEHGVRIVGDIPIFVAPDSVDVWTNRELFKLDSQGNQLAGSGVPPDAFSSDGQLWGNPLYDWAEHEKSGFAWWIRRMKHMFTLSDIVRIDHFRGFCACWEVPQGEKTAINGKWVPSPGTKFFDCLKKELGEDLPVIAEDLGVITEDVATLRDSNNFPGMKILQFAFGSDQKGRLDATNAYLPHNCAYQSIIYTGTHDNNTTRGWYDSLDGHTKDMIRRYLECPDDQVVWQLIRSALMCGSKAAIFPMQDWLELSFDARMNTPSTCGGDNWSWRLESLDIPSWRIDRLRDMISLYGREGN
ncbi:MAG: 4-alpha-glucanotransferase [Sphaerochaetaceae bacterium]